MRYRLILLMLLLVLATSYSQAQDPTPSPAKSPASSADPSASSKSPDEDATLGNFIITSSVEFGVRGARIRGDHDLYQSQLNYQPGFRIFDSSFLARAKEGATGTLFDTLLVNSTGWGADPAGSLRINVEKPKWYRFDGNFRRDAYDSRLVNFANPFATVTNGRLGQQNFRTKHKFGDFDLKLLPLNRKFRFTLGYSFDRNSGPASTTYDYSGDEYPLLYNFKTAANEYRAGIEGQLAGIDLSFLQGLRYYKDDPLFTSGVNQGNNSTDISMLTTLQRTQPDRGRVAYSRFSAHKLIEQRFDITARYTYTKAKSEDTFFETITGRQGSRNGGNFINPDIFVSPGTVERPSHLVDVGMTWLATKKLRISDTIRYYKFNIEGAHQYTETLFLRKASNTTVNAVPTTPVLPFPTITSLTATRTIDYSRFLNQIEADYQFGPRLAIHGGYRFTHRTTDEEEVGDVLTPTTPVIISEQFTNDTHTVFAGFKARPWNFWNIYMDFSKGTTDNVFERTEQYHTTYFRVRNRFQISKDLSAAVSVVTRDNHNPGDFDPILAPELQGLSALVKSRVFTSTVDWSPSSKFSLSSGYTYTDLTSNVDIIFFVASSARRVGSSQYYMRDNFFFANASIQPFPRFTAYIGYRINRDPGQGDRPSTPDPNTIVRSLPYHLQSPEVRLVFKLNNRMDLNAGYQYYGYKDKVLAPEDFRFQQSYTSSLPYISLRLYLGRRE